MTNNKKSPVLTNTLTESVKTRQEPIENNSIDNPIIRNNNKNAKQKPRTIFLVKKNNEKTTRIVLCGQDAKTLLALIRAGNEGRTSLEVSSWAFAMSSYISNLRNRHGLNIKTVMEAHDKGSHARYFLQDNVEIIEMSNF